METTERVFEPVIDMHDTWMVGNPFQGCPVLCLYCFLRDMGQTRVKPYQLATPEETVKQLLAHRYYRPDTPIAFYTCSDALSTPPIRAHLVGLLNALIDSPVRNPVCFITKFQVTPDVLDAMSRARAAGLPVIVYLSYSGLGSDVEQGIRHDLLRANFPPSTTPTFRPSTTSGPTSRPTPRRR